MSKSARGIFGLTKVDSIATPQLSQLTNSGLWSASDISGVAVRTDWNKVEGTEGTRDWTYLDAAMSLAVSNRKKIGMWITAGTSSPAWVYTDGAASFVLAQGTMPVPWDAVFLSKWHSLITAMGIRYSTHPNLAYVSIGGIGSQMELFLSNNTTDDAAFNAAGGLTSWTTAANTIVGYYIAAFRRTPVVVSTGNPLTTSAGQTSANSLCDSLASQYGERFGLKSNGLLPTLPSLSSYPGSRFPALSSTNSVGFQMNTQGTVFTGGTLQDALNRGISLGAQYIEVYSADCLDDTQISLITSINISLMPGFPVSADVFKTIPNPTVTATSLFDANNDTLSTRLQQHSDSIVSVETYLLSHKTTNVVDFGADPTGTSDSTAAIQNACNIGGLVIFPAGTYKISGIITLSHPGLLMGGGIASTIITTTSATADMFFISGSGITITQMQFSSSVTRTAGYCIDCQTVAPSQQIIIRDIQMNAPFNGIHATFLGTIASVFIYNVVSAGSGIVVESVAEQVEIDYVTCTGGSAGLNIVSAPNGVLISHSYFFGMRFGILLQGQGTVGIDSIYINQCFIDGLSTNGYGIYITSQSSAAFVSNIKITESHIANAPLQGIILLTSGGGVITRVNISTTHVGHCGADAIAIASSGVWDFQIKDCILLLNGYAVTGHGITIAANTQSFIITGNKIGSTQTTTGNTGFGINLGTGCTNAIISGNDLRGNTLGEQGGTLAAPFVNVNNL